MYNAAAGHRGDPARLGGGARRPPVGDKILEINGKKVPNYSTLQHVMGPLYEGDEIALKIKRGDKEMEFKKHQAARHGDGLRQRVPRRAADARRPGAGRRGPLRVSQEPGRYRGRQGRRPHHEVRARVSRALRRSRTGRRCITAMQPPDAGAEVKVEVKRKDGGKVETVTAKLVAMPEELPEKLPLPSSAGKALEGQPKPKDCRRTRSRHQKDPFPPKKQGPFARPFDARQKKDESSRTRRRTSRRSRPASSTADQPGARPRILDFRAGQLRRRTCRTG